MFIEVVYVYAKLFISFQGILNFGDDCEVSVHYSIPKDSFGGDKNIMKNDWTCYKVSIDSNSLDFKHEIITICAHLNRFSKFKDVYAFSLVFKVKIRADCVVIYIRC